jgi:molecular chaperone GrpE
MDDDNQEEQLEQSSLKQIQDDLDIANNNWKRALADFENYKRRKEGENKELVEFAREVTVVKLLPTLDSLEQALKHAPLFPLPLGEGQGEGPEFGKKYQNWMNGINGIVVQLDKALEELGVRKIESLGKKFNPHFHEAVREVESEADDGMVVDELQTGFELNGKVIRPSQVTISKKAAKGGE